MLRIPARRAFTLVELLTVIAIIGVLASILIPGTSKVRLKAQRMDSIANLRSLGVAVSLFTNDNKDKLPGPLSHTQYAFRKNGDTSQLSHWLADHTGFIVKPDDPVSILGHKRFFSQYGHDLTHYTAYITNQKVYIGGQSGNSPWGWSGAASGDIKRIPKQLHTLDTPSRALALMEVDQELLTDTTAKASGQSPEKPLFDDGRAALFFDWHVKVVPFSVKLGNNK
ncbi:MAG: type II secretion system GspH family protein [Opitutaceae bacterium]|nr:type II secretion system GspH family protein [Opitutaceae bacterium]